MKTASKKQHGRYSGSKTSIHSIPNYQRKYPGFETYVLEGSPVHTSPCMDPHWRSQPIRQGKARDEHDFELKPDEED